jgi:hypothetical protein
MEVRTYPLNYAMMRELWPDWNATDASAGLFAERCADLNQRVLMDVIKRHRCEPAGQYKEPKIHRVLEMYGEVMRESSVRAQFSSQVVSTDLTPEEAAELDIEADEIISTATDEEVRAARALYPINPDLPGGKRMLAAALRRMRGRR